MSDWKETELGRLPSHWDLLSIDEIKSPNKKSIISGPFGSNISAKFFVDFGIPVIRGNNLSLSLTEKFKDNGFVYITEEKANELNTWAECNDLVFTAVGTIGQVGIISEYQQFSKYIISNKQLRLTVDAKKVIPLYAYYWFASPSMIDMIQQRNTGSSVPLINLSVLKSLLIPVPPIPEQKAITEVLSSLDHKIDLLHRQNRTLEAMAETLFRQWFIEDSEEDWEEEELGAFVDFNYGKGLKKSDRTGKGYPVYGSSGVVDYHEEYLVKGPGIITGRKGTLGIVNYSFENFYPIDTTFYITSKQQSERLYFEYFLLRELNLGEMNTDSAVPGLNRNLAHKIPVKIPKNEKVDKFNSFSDPLFSKIRLNQIQVQTLEKLRDTLLPKLMSGEVRIK